MKRIIYSLFALLAIASSCSKDDPTPGPVPLGEAMVEIDINSSIQTKATDDEKKINNLVFLVFDGKETNSKFLYSRHAWLDNTSNSTYRSTLLIADDITIYFAANAKDFIDSVGVLAGETWQDVQKKFAMSTPERLKEDNIPMWGRLVDLDIVDKSVNDLGMVQLYRSVALIDVEMTMTEPEKVFELEKVYLVYAPSKGFLHYDPANLNIAGTEFLTPSSPSGMVTTYQKFGTPKTGEYKVNSQLYFYENATPINGNTTPNRQTKAVIAGKWLGAGGSGLVTYYPLSLRKEDTGKMVKIQATRNTRYLIKVTKVGGDGYPDLETAKKSEDVSVDYEVIEWNENTDGDIFIDGSRYLSIGSKTAILNRTKGSVCYIPFSTNFNIDSVDANNQPIIGDFRMNFDNGTTWQSSKIDDHSRFDVEILKATFNGVEKKAFKFSAKLDYGTTDNPAVLYVKVSERVKFKITVVQKSSMPNDWLSNGNDIIIEQL